MATPTPPPPVEPVIVERATPVERVVSGDDIIHPTADRQFVASPIGWSSILAATVITLGVWLALHLFGIGVGLTAIDPKDAGSLRGAGIGVGVWSVIAPILALFVGGLVAGRVAPTINTLNAVIHGGVVWALSLLLTMLLLMSMFGALARGAMSAGTVVVDTAGAAVGAAGGAGESLEAVGIDADALFAPINRQLQERGMPPVEPAAAKQVVQEVVQTSLQDGSLDRQKVVAIVAKRTALSRQDAEQVATEIEKQYGELAQQGREAVDQAQETALSAADTTGKVLMAVVGLMVLGLGAAIAGAILSVRRERREHVVLPRATTR